MNVAVVMVNCSGTKDFFFEMHRAFKEGRAEVDPELFWYKGEIGFIDFYNIPLTKKLKECGVFGVSGVRR